VQHRKPQQSHIYWKKFIITERDANNSKPEDTSGRNAKFDCETKTETNSRQRDCANVHQQETVRMLDDKNGKMSALVEEYYNLVVLNQEVEHTLRHRISHIHRIKKRYEEENRALLRKIIGMEDEIISLKQRRPPLTERETEDHVTAPDWSNSNRVFSVRCERNSLLACCNLQRYRVLVEVEAFGSFGENSTTIVCGDYSNY
jgi:predicted RNase H-like nuclease (RuvC/YqgF family)